MQATEIALRRIRSPHSYGAELKALRDHAAEARCCLQAWRSMFSPSHLPQLIISSLCTAIQQLTGINFLIFYGPQLFTNLGFDATWAHAVGLMLDFCIFVGSLVALALVDVVGRRRLIISGSLIAAIAMFGVAILMTVTENRPWMPWGVLGFALTFITAYGWSWGVFGWTFPVEVQHTPTRAVGMSITAFFNVFFSAITAQAILTMNCSLREGLFYFFGCTCLGAAALTWWLFPETRGIDLQRDIGGLFHGRAWRRARVS